MSKARGHHGVDHRRYLRFGEELSIWMNVTYMVEIERVIDLRVFSLPVWPRSCRICCARPCHGKMLTVSKAIGIRTIKM